MQACLFPREPSTNLPFNIKVRVQVTWQQNKNVVVEVILTNIQERDYIGTHINTRTHPKKGDKCGEGIPFWVCIPSLGLFIQ
uniref:Uncharacterized protein n=1 Tax=Picea sitchensis TaxID=3332 RepID=D5A814_PICSI|nr:unknown [Picea sitchensis]